MICEIDAYIPLTFYDLPNEIIQIIIGYLRSDKRVKTKMTCKLMYNLVNDFPFDIAKKILFKNFGLFTFRTFCANCYCCDDTEDVFYRHYRKDDSYYEHIYQLALNKTEIIINNKFHTVRTHYCSECFKKYVLVGDRENVIHNYSWIDEVNITYEKINL